MIDKYNIYLTNHQITPASDTQSIVKLSCGISFALGTTSYQLTYKGLNYILNKLFEYNTYMKRKSKTIQPKQ